MIDLKDVLLLHDYSIADFGGTNGIRDMEMIKSGIERPFQTFDGEELYADVISKAAAIVESIVVNHPFVDGNKRTGFLAMLAFLMEHHYKMTASNDELYDFIINIASGLFRFDDIVDWLRENVSI